METALRGMMETALPGMIKTALRSMPGRLNCRDVTGMRQAGRTYLNYIIILLFLV